MESYVDLYFNIENLTPAGWGAWLKVYTPNLNLQLQMQAVDNDLTRPALSSKMCLTKRI